MNTIASGFVLVLIIAVIFLAWQRARRFASNVNGTLNYISLITDLNLDTLKRQTGSINNIYRELDELIDLLVDDEEQSEPDYEDDEDPELVEAAA